MHHRTVFLTSTSFKPVHKCVTIESWKLKSEVGLSVHLSSFLRVETQISLTVIFDVARWFIIWFREVVLYQENHCTFREAQTIVGESGKLAGAPLHCAAWHTRQSRSEAYLETKKKKQYSRLINICLSQIHYNRSQKQLKTKTIMLQLHW